MLLDAQNLFSDAQSVAHVTGAFLSDTSIDLGAAGTSPLGTYGVPAKDVGRGKTPRILCQVVVAVVGTSSTLFVELVNADDAALTSNLVVLQQTQLIAEAVLVAGYQFRLAIPVGVAKQYLGLRYNVGTATTTLGKITAGIVWDEQTTFVG